MPLIVDTHVHIYPCHDAGRLLNGVVERLGRLAPGAHRAICLVERQECHWFSDASKGALPKGWSADPVVEAGALRLRRDADQASLWVLSGFQYNASERLELLALAATQRVTDGLPIRELIAQVRSSGAIPVLPWSPGKWLFGRGRILQRLQMELPPGSFLLGDSSLRCIGWPEPAAMAVAHLGGRPPLAGTDPLPFAGEERVAGTYASFFREELEAQRPLTSARALLGAGGGEQRGRRASPLSMIRRLILNRATRSGS